MRKLQVLGCIGESREEFKSWMVGLEKAFENAGVLKYLHDEKLQRMDTEMPEFDLVLKQTVFIDNDTRIVYDGLSKHLIKEGEKLRQDVQVSSPGTWSFKMAEVLRTTEDPHEYWMCVDRHYEYLDRFREQRKEANKKIDEGMEILMMCTSRSLQKTLCTKFDERNIASIYKAIKFMYGYIEPVKATRESEIPTKEKTGQVKELRNTGEMVIASQQKTIQVKQTVHGKSVETRLQEQELETTKLAGEVEITVPAKLGVKNVLEKDIKTPERDLKTIEEEITVSAQTEVKTAEKEEIKALERDLKTVTMLQKKEIALPSREEPKTVQKEEITVSAPPEVKTAEKKEEITVSAPPEMKTSNKTESDHETTGINDDVKPTRVQACVRCGGWEAACELQELSDADPHAVPVGAVAAQQVDDQDDRDTDATRERGPQGGRQLASDRDRDATRVRGPQGGRQATEQVMEYITLSRSEEKLQQRHLEGEKEDSRWDLREGCILDKMKKFDPGGNGSSGKLSVLQACVGGGWFQVRGARLKTKAGPHWKPYDPGGTRERHGQG